LLRTAEPFCHFCHFCGTFIYHAAGFSTKEYFCPAEIKEIKEIFVPTREALSVISALSVGHYYLMRIVFLLSRSHRLCRFARRRNKRNKGNLLAPSAKPFLPFLLFLRDDYYLMRIVFIVPIFIVPQK